MKLQKHHIEWLERNDGEYEIIPDRCRFERDGVHFVNKMRVHFKYTAFTFNENGLSQAIDNILELYPES